MAHLSLSLMGEFQAALSGEPVIGFHSDKVRALLAYLAVEASQPHTRAQLAGLLWPDWPERAARTYLRQALFDLRRLLKESEATTPFLLADRRTIQFNRQSDHSLDVAALHQAVKAATNATAPLVRDDLDQWQQVAARCTGNFMEGFFLDGCSAYEEWQLLTRERLRRALLQLLRTLIDGYEQIGDFRQALQQAWLQAELDPLLDAAHWQIISLLSRIGDPGAALAHYHRYCSILDEELGAEPAAEVVTLVEQIRAGHGPVAVRAVPGSTTAPSGSNIPCISLPASILAAAPPVSRPHFVARDVELAALTAFLERALPDQGGVAFVCGDAGMGKTTLMHEFAVRSQARWPALVVVAGTCDAHTGTGDPYQPFREILGLLSGEIEAAWRSGAITRPQAAALWRMFPSTLTNLMDAGPNLVGTLIHGRALLTRVIDSGLDEFVDVERLRMMSERGAVTSGLQQSALFEQTAAILRMASEIAPLLLILDDLQWADPGSINLLFQLGRRLAGFPILIMGSYRPEEIAVGRHGEPHPLSRVLLEFQQMYGDITVDLRLADGQHFVERFIDAQPNLLGVGFRASLHAQSQGHALFTVELMSAMQERADLVQDADGRWMEGESLNWAVLPARVEAAIAQRIDRLPAQLRDLLSIACVEGERFTAEIAAQIAGLDGQTCIRWLSAELDRKYQIVTAGSTRRLNGVRHSRYQFRHILFQKYLYGALDDVERVTLHERIGLCLEAICEGEEAALDTYAQRLALHFHRARLYEKAILYYRRASTVAVRMVAAEEAIGHLETALQLLDHVADETRRARLELRLQEQLLVVLSRIRGQRPRGTVPIYERVIELANQVGDLDSKFQAYHGLWLQAWLRADLERARRFAEWMSEQALRSQDPAQLACAYSAQGHIAFTAGDVARSRDSFQQAVFQCDLARRTEDAGPLGDDVVASSFQFLAHALWILGYPDQALHRLEEMRNRFPSGTAPYNQAHLDVGAMALYQYRREPEKTRQAAETVLAQSRRYGFTHWTSWAEFMHGWAQASLSEGCQGLDEMARGADIWTSFTWAVRRRVIMADAYARAGQLCHGLTTLDEALELVEQTGERLSEAELYRLRGSLLLIRRRDGELDVSLPEIRSCFCQAIEVARRQQAKTWELRATTDLCRLLFEQGNAGAAREMLAPIYGWFTEGFDTPDLAAARELLDELDKAVSDIVWT